MAVILNAKGTSVPYFTVGKNGTTIFQGLDDPSLTYTVKSGDIWLDSSAGSIHTYSTDAWVAPRLGTFTIPDDSGHQNKFLTTDGSGNLSWVTVNNSQPYTAGTGLSLTGNEFANTGVLSLTAGSNIAVSGTTGNITVSLTGTVPTATLSTLATSSTTSTNIANGAAGSIPYQTASDTTSMLSAGSSNQVLTSGTTPKWHSQFTSSPTPPNNPEIGDEWVDTDTGVKYTYFNDGETSSWVNFTNTSIPSDLSLTSLSTTGAVNTSGGLVISKSSGVGIKVDTTTPTFGWRDIICQIEVRGSGVNNPDFAQFRTNIFAYQFAVNDQAWLLFHIPHDYVPGSELYIHAHWAITTTSTANVTWGWDATYAKGHGQEAFPATINKTVTQAAAGIAYNHMVAEVQLTDGTGKINGNTVEVDGMILMRVYLSANATGVDPFLFTSDLHYQSSNMATKGKAPNFYA